MRTTSKKRPYKKRRQVTKRRRSSMTVKRRVKRKENKFLQFVTKALRLLLLFGICALIIYIIYKPDEPRQGFERFLAGLLNQPRQGEDIGKLGED